MIGAHGLGRRLRLGVLSVVAVLGACTSVEKIREGASIELVAEPEWRTIARDEHVQQIDQLASAWNAGLSEARARGFRRAVTNEGELLDPDAALARPAPSPGPYHCRVIKLGGRGRGNLAFVAHKPFFCYIEAEGPLLTIVKQTGSERPAGRLYPDANEERLIFLGTLALGNDEAPLAYGEKPSRDMAGVLERVAPFRFRLVVPTPRDQSKIDVIELVPATQ